MLIPRCRYWGVVAYAVSLAALILSHSQAPSCAITEPLFSASESPRIEMPFEKVCDGAKKTLHDMEEYHHSALLNDHLWLFSRKYKEQPTHHWGHRVSFAGGYSAYFDIGSKQWSAKQDVAPISNEENLEERLFVFNSNIYLILYTAFGGIAFKDLFKWDTAARNWTKVNEFQVDAANNKADSEASGPSELIVVDQEGTVKDSIYLVSVVGHAVRVHQLSASGHLSLVHDVALGDKLALSRPVMAARSDHDIYMIIGEHGCGFHVNPKKWITFCLKSNAAEIIDLDGEAPPFAFSGSRYTKVMPGGVWVHATGSVRQGMESCAFNGEVWSVELKSKPLKWKKSPEAVPAMHPEQLVIAVTDAGLLYAADHDHGVHVAKLA